PPWLPRPACPEPQGPLAPPGRQEQPAPWEPRGPLACPEPQGPLAPPGRQEQPAPWEPRGPLACPEPQGPLALPEPRGPLGRLWGPYCPLPQPKALLRRPRRFSTYKRIHASS